MVGANAVIHYECVWARYDYKNALLTLVNNYTSSRGHDDPNKEAAVVVECSKGHAPRGGIRLYLFLRSEAVRYVFFYLLLQASLFSDNCSGEWVLRLTVWWWRRKARQSNADFGRCVGIKVSVWREKDAVMTSMEVLLLRDPWMGTQNMSRPSPLRYLYLQCAFEPNEGLGTVTKRSTYPKPDHRRLISIR